MMKSQLEVWGATHITLLLRSGTVMSTFQPNNRNMFP